MKERIKSVLHYKKPAFWIVVLAVIACVVVAVCFLTDPVEGKPDFTAVMYDVSAENPPITLEGYLSDAPGAEVYFMINGLRYTVISGPVVSEQQYQLKADVEDGMQKVILSLQYGERDAALYMVLQDGSERVYACDIAELKRLLTWQNSGIPVDLSDYRHHTDPETLPALTLTDVITLSAKSEDLTWSDFAGYSYTDIGSGLYIWHLPIDEVFSVKVGGGSVMTAPIYVYLCAGSGEAEERIDIRDGGVDEFIGKHAGIEETDTTYFSNTIQKEIADLFAEIESSPSYSSNPKDYIDAHPDEYSKLIEYGNHTLVYVFNEFLAGGQTGLHGHILSSVMLDLLNENEIIKYDPTNGQDYFDQWLASARSVGEQHDPVWLEVNVPSIALVLKMAGDISTETYVDQTEVDPDPIDTAISRALNQHYRDDEPTGLLHGISYVLLANETVSGTPRFGQTNHIEKEIYYLLVMHQKYSMQNGQPTAIGGSYIPTVLTFTKEDNGKYILDEYWEPRDGSYYDDDIKAKFPAGIIDEVWNMDAYSEKLEKQCADDVFVYVDNYQAYTEPGDL